MPTPDAAHDPDLVCPHCGEHVKVVRDGWAFIYTQVLMHLDRCAAELSTEERQRLATAAAEKARR